MKRLLITGLLVLTSVSAFAVPANADKALDCQLETLTSKEPIKFELPINKGQKTIKFIAEAPTGKKVAMQVNADNGHGYYLLNAEVILPSDSSKGIQSMTRSKTRDLFLQVSYLDGLYQDFANESFLVNITCR